MRRAERDILTMPIALMIAGAILLTAMPTAQADDNDIRLPVKVSIGIDQTDSPQEMAGTIKIMLFFALLSLVPALLLTMTSFTRIIIVLSFARRALSLQSLPPNQVVIGLALFLTLFVMAPVFEKINDLAIQPYLAEEIGQGEAVDNALAELRDFMFKQTREKDLALFVGMAGRERPNDKDDVPTYVLVPAFITSELKTAFQMGFVIYLPFLVIDMVVSSVLTSMGMFMLPPVIISVPFKILLFVMVDGWHLVLHSLAAGFVR